MATREELIKAAKRKMLLQKAKEKMALSQSVPQEAIVEGPQADQTAGGFLGAQIPAPTGTSVPVMEGLGNLAQDVSTGVVEAARAVPLAGPLAEKMALGITGEDPEAFKQRREELKAASPNAAMVGELAGTLGGFAAAPQTILPQIGLSAADMVAEGMSPGEMAGPLALEGSLGLTGKLLSKLKGLGPKLEMHAGKQAEKAAGLDMTKSLRKKLAHMENTGQIKEGELGNRLLDEGVVAAGDSATVIAAKAKEMGARAGEEIGELLKGKQTPTQVAKDLLAGKLDGTALSEIQKKISKKINTQISMLDEAGETIDLATLNKIKGEIGEEVKDFTSKAATKQAGRKMYEALKESVEFSIGDAELTRIREMNKKFQAAKLAEDAAEGAAHNRPSELSKSMALYGMASGNHVLPAVVATKAVWNKYGAALAAAGLKKGASLGKYADKFAEAAEKGPAAIGALHYQLMQDDESYRKKHGKGE